MTRLDGVWGTVPLEPPANISGVWGGIVGDIIDKRQHLSISGWLNKYDRRDMFDFVPVLSDAQILVVSPRPPEYDTDLFIRPFSRKAWIGLGLFIAAISAVITLPTFLITG